MWRKLTWFSLLELFLRFDAPVINSRMRQCWIHNELDLALGGPNVELTYDYDHLGDSTEVAPTLTVLC